MSASAAYTPAEIERRTAGYMRKGSPAAIPGKCGSQLPQRGCAPGTPWRYCKQDPLKGRERCRLHGGASLIGPAHPSFKQGLFSLALLNTPLQAGYEALQGDRELLSVQSQIRLLNGRMLQLAQRCVAPGGESAAGWTQAAQAFRELEAATAAGSAVGFKAAQERLGAILLRGAAAERDWQEERALAAVHARLVETEHRLLERGKHLIPVDAAIQYSAAVAGLATPRMSGPSEDECRAWAAGIEGAPAQLGEQLAAWLRIRARKALSEFAHELRALAEGGGVEAAEIIQGEEGAA